MSHFMSPSCVFHMWLHTSTLQTTSFLILEFFQTQLLLKTQVLDVRRKRLWSFQTKRSAVTQKTIQAFTRHTFWNPHWEVLDRVSTEGGPPPCPCPDLTPLRLSNISQWQTLKAFLSFHGKNSLWFCDLYRGFGFFLLLIFYYFTFLLFSLLKCFGTSQHSAAPPSSLPFPKQHITSRPGIVSEPRKNSLEWSRLVFNHKCQYT